MQIKIKKEEWNKKFYTTESDCGRFLYRSIQPNDLYDTKKQRHVYQGRWSNRADEGFGNQGHVDEEGMAIIRRFYAAIREYDASQQKIKDERAMAQVEEESRAWREKYGDMSHLEFKKMSQQYDNLHNEGCEGFNPYR